MSKVSVNLTMFEGKTRECISRAVQQRMFDWGYKWSSVYTEYRYTQEGYLYMSTDGTITYSSEEISHYKIPHNLMSCEYLEYTAEEFLSLTADPLKEFEVGEPYTDNERVVICTESVDALRFKGVSIYNVHPWKHDGLWKESEYPKCMFVPIDHSRIQIEVLPCK